MIQVMKKDDPKITSTQELKLIVQNKLGIPDITKKTRKPQYAFAKFLVIALSIKYTFDTYDRMCAVLNYKSHASIHLGKKQFEDLTGQKVFELYEFLYYEISEEMDYRLDKKRNDIYKKIEDNEKTKKDYQIKIWKIIEHHHSIRRKMAAKINELEKQLKIYSNGNIQKPRTGGILNDSQRIDN